MLEKMISKNKLIILIALTLLFTVIHSFAQPIFTSTEIITPKITASELNTIIRVTGNTGADIQAAIDIANARTGFSGGTIFIPPGTYTLSEPILLYNNIYLEGVRGATILTVNGNTFNGDAVIKSGRRDVDSFGVYDVTGISDMTIKVTGSLNNGNGVIAIDVTGMRYSKFENLDIYGSGLWEGIVFLLGDTVDDPNNPGSVIARKTTFFNLIENIDAVSSGNWNTFLKMKSDTGNANHNYGRNVNAKAEYMFDATEMGAAGPAIVLLGCYFIGNNGPSAFKDNFKPGQSVFIECTSEPGTLDEDLSSELLIFGAMTVQEGGMGLGNSAKVSMGPTDIEGTEDNAPASALPIPPLNLANHWMPALRIAQFSNSKDSSDLMYSRYFDIEMILGTDYKLIIGHLGKSSEGMTIDNKGNVGIGTETPVTKLDVDGSLRLTPTDTQGTCDSSRKGAIYVDDSLSELCYCNGLAWNQFDGGGVC